MINRKILIIFFALILLAGAVSALEQTYCCEKTTNGAWCQNAAQDQCDTSHQMAATSCEATSYCRLGCCFDTQEGTCKENTPELRCGEGIWKDSASCEISECTLGCCLIGEQAAFTTQTRCKRLAGLYGLQINFRQDLNNEFQCIAAATADVKGACVYEEEFQKTCEMTTKKKCQERNDAGNATQFYEGKLCSSEELNTICGPTEKHSTTCVDGKDGVYFVDSCGNLANIYDSTKINDKSYWDKIISEADSCGVGESNAGSKTCGNCDYYLGSTCKEASIGNSPTYGDNICVDLSCTYEGKRYEHGETWCVNSDGVNKNLPGSRYFRAVCYNSEVTIEPCADFRNEICKEEKSDSGYMNAACVVNKWQDCAAQTSKSNCENRDARDCKWVDTIVGGKVIEGQSKCVPLYTPGFDFWQTEGSCSSSNAQVTLKYERKLFGSWDCVDNCEFEDLSNSGSALNKVCAMQGDCGGSTNFIGVQGYGKGYSLKTTETETLDGN